MQEIDLSTRLRMIADQIIYKMRDFMSPDAKPPIDKLLDLIFETAIKSNATDIHIEPRKDDIKFRYRIDGELCTLHKPLDKRIQSVLSNKTKILASMDTTKRFIPLDGHFDYEFEDKTIDIRVSSMPTKYDESFVIRLMDANDKLKRIDELGINKEIEGIFKKIIHMSNGMFIVTGPMNSGKSTSLYAALRELNDDTLNIMTVEDPIEQLIDGINQTETNERVKLDFASSLRAMLRMDCNVIMVGEIRDVETAQIAIRAALTGHLILTTLHAKDSCSAIFRLLEMNVEPYLLAATLNGVMSQRLVRKLCPHCKQSYEVDENSIEAQILGDKFSRGTKLYKPVGCEKCRNSGFKGRFAIHEILVIDEDFRRMILKFDDVDDLRKLSAKKKNLTMLDDGIQKAIEGLTTINEVQRVL